MPLIDFLPALPWLAPFAALARLARTGPTLADVPPTTGEPVSIVIPARNEADTLETVVESILRSTYHPFELLIVDDRSTDGTHEIAARLARADGRVRVISGAPLPEGWYGKPWACEQGYRAATGTLLLFTDADTRHQPQLLGHAVASLRRNAADLLTVQPHQRCVTFWERLVMPQVWLLLALRYHPSRVNRARRERDVIANGQFILTTRGAYEAVGRHAAVRREVAEDLALAQAYLRGGRKIRFDFAMGLMETRMYRNLDHLIEGWSKNIYLGGRRSFPNEPILRAMVPAILAAAVGFWLVPLLGLGLAAGGYQTFRGLAPAALMATGWSALFWMGMCHGMGIAAPYGLGYPLGAAMTLFIVARSTWRGGRKVEWRGRIYGMGDPAG